MPRSLSFYLAPAAPPKSTRRLGCFLNFTERPTLHPWLRRRWQRGRSWSYGRRQARTSSSSAATTVGAAGAGAATTAGSGALGAPLRGATAWAWCGATPASKRPSTWEMAWATDWVRLTARLKPQLAAAVAQQQASPRALLLGLRRHPCPQRRLRRRKPAAGRPRRRRARLLGKPPLMEPQTLPSVGPRAGPVAGRCCPRARATRSAASARGRGRPSRSAARAQTPALPGTPPPAPPARCCRRRRWWWACAAARCGAERRAFGGRALGPRTLRRAPRAPPRCTW
jgi:hypothetical protein